MFDFHRHLSKNKPREDALYCTSKKNEWNQSSLFFSLGLLQIKKYEKSDLDKILNLLKNKIENNKSLSIGEIGLDKRWENIENQIYFLKKSLKLATKYKRVITIHCVQEYQLLISILKNEKSLPPLIIIHNYTSSYEIAEQLKKYNAIISINNRFLKTKSFKDILKFDNLGFLVESDWDKDNEIDYIENFNSFLDKLNTAGAYKYKEFNNEIRSILKNLTINR